MPTPDSGPGRSAGKPRFRPDVADISGGGSAEQVNGSGCLLWASPIAPAPALRRGGRRNKLPLIERYLLRRAVCEAFQNLINTEFDTIKNKHRSRSVILRRATPRGGFAERGMEATLPRRALNWFVLFQGAPL